MTVNNDKTWCPAVELNETDTALILKAEVPGVDLKHLNVQAETESISISGDRSKQDREDQKEIVPSQLHYGQLQCNIPLPIPIQVDRVSAELIDGVLTITMPKLQNPQENFSVSTAHK